MTWQHRYELGDPFEVLARKQAKQARTKQGRQEKAKRGLEALFGGEALTQDQSEQVEALLDTWYGYERAYMPALGAPRVSVSCRGFDPGDVYESSDDRDAKLEKVTAEAVEACVDELPVLQRAAIGVHMRNKQVKAGVHRNPRIEDQHRAYQDAKAALFPKLKRKGLVR